MSGYAHGGRRATDGDHPPALRESGPDWVAYLESLAVFGMRPGLARVEWLLERLGRPQDAYRVIHVVGTNGKSSTTRFCEALLHAAGLRSGAYLSPHILGWNERVLVDGHPVNMALLGDCVGRVRGMAGRLPAEMEDATQFEVLTVAALLALAESGVEAVALEAGLGGRLDATNVVSPPVVVLPNVGLDHTQVLGESRELILAEKAAVIKGGHAVFGGLDGLEMRAARLALQAGARPWLLDRDFVIEGSPAEMSVQMFREGALVEKAAVAGAAGGPGLPEPVTGRDVRLLERWDDLRLATLALYQVTNAGLAVVAVRLLLGALDEDAARRALARVVVPGRFHKVGDRPLVIADGAHNADGMRALARSLAALGPPAPRVGLLAIMRDKGYDEMLAAILPLLDVVVCAHPSEPRSLTAEELAAAVTRVGATAASELAEIIVEPSPQAALSLARQRAGAGGSVVVTGSLFLLEELHALIARSI